MGHHRGHLYAVNKEDLDGAYTKMLRAAKGVSQCQHMSNIQLLYNFQK